ncbi:helix-turn-helix domain-containing protein [Amycolatopsis carbonis]|uniref:Helix-turn-helix domain-containing protein n=1 Tax=Amycolatopsis carbonis TaxID=715471 RepID=A0A9Y2IKV8_9PSEU|nr:helix-turn-helix domain-containing protein [Amycolatopsis sp. 2-15]WIX82220.1 helix-turn-helix domain-containing protein [Amycolatopsis sp. 2-15]
MAHRSAGQSVLARVVAVLEAFDLDHGSLTASDIARRAGLSTPTAHRIVAELVELGLLERGEGHRVHVGARFWEIAAMAPRALGLREANHCSRKVRRTRGPITDVSTRRGASWWGGSFSRSRLGGRHGFSWRKLLSPTPAPDSKSCQSTSAVRTCSYRAMA